MLSSGVTIADTQLEILNTKLYERVSDFPANSKIPNFVHLMAVNRMARTGTNWISLFSERNSGTHNTQYLVLDYGLFQKGAVLPPGTFQVVEIIPGLIIKQDQTQHLLNNGWWASYNRPYYQRVRDETGHNSAVAKYGLLFSYDENPRAQIFSAL